MNWLTDMQEPPGSCISSLAVDWCQVARCIIPMHMLSVGVDPVGASLLLIQHQPLLHFSIPQDALDHSIETTCFAVIMIARSAFLPLNLVNDYNLLMAPEQCIFVVRNFLLLSSAQHSLYVWRAT